MEDMTETTTVARLLAADFRTWLVDNVPVGCADAARRACCSRGNRKGLLLRHAPKHEAGAAVWHSLISIAAPPRASLWGPIFYAGSARQAYDAMEEWLRSDARARLVVKLGAGRPFEFNVEHVRFDDKLLAEWAETQGIDPTVLGVRA